MNKRTFAVGALVLAVVLAGGGLFASNMGFKLNYQLLGPGGSSANGTNTLSLPYIQQVGLSDAQSLINDIGSLSVTNVQELDEATNSLNVYDGISGPNFTLTAGTGYFVRVSATTNYIVVGAHDPSLAVSLDGPGAGSANGTNFFSFPYHHTASDAQGLINDIGSLNVTNVQQLNKLDNSLNVYDGISGPNFTLVPGESYFVRMSSTVNYVPSHY